MLKKLASMFLGLLSLNAFSAEALCPVNPIYQTTTCYGSVRVVNTTQLETYKNTLNINPKTGLARNLIIDFDVASSDNVQISSPCQITLSQNFKIQSDKNICLHGDRGVQLGVNSIITGNNIRLEALDEVYIRDFSKTTALGNLELISLGNTITSKVLVLQGNTISAKNILIDSYDRSGISKESIITATESFGMYSKSLADSILGINVKLTSPRVEISSNDDLRIASGVVVSSNELLMNC